MAFAKVVVPKAKLSAAGKGVVPFKGNLTGSAALNALEGKPLGSLFKNATTPKGFEGKLKFLTEGGNKELWLTGKGKTKPTLLFAAKNPAVVETGSGLLVFEQGIPKQKGPAFAVLGRDGEVHRWRFTKEAMVSLEGNGKGQLNLSITQPTKPTKIFHLDGEGAVSSASTEVAALEFRFDLAARGGNNGSPVRITGRRRNGLDVARVELAENTFPLPAGGIATRPYIPGEGPLPAHTKIEPYTPRVVEASARVEPPFGAQRSYATFAQKKQLPEVKPHHRYRFATKA